MSTIFLLVGYISTKISSLKAAASGEQEYKKWGERQGIIVFSPSAQLIIQPNWIIFNHARCYLHEN